MDMITGPSVTIVTTVGQARNALALAPLLAEPQTFAIFYTSRNTSVRDRITDYLRERDQSFTLVTLPDFPTIPTPSTVRAMKKIYEYLLEKYNPSNLFVSNRENHYRIAIETFNASGVSVKYFEEGLSSYKAGMNIEPTSVFTLIKNTHTDIKGFLKKHKSRSIILFILYWIYTSIIQLISEPIHLFSFIRHSRGSFAKHLYKSALWTKIAPIFGLGVVKKYYSKYSEFDKAFLFFPEANVAFPDEIVTQLPKAVSHSEPDLLIMDDVRLMPRLIYVGQKYNGAQNFYRSVVASIKDSMATLGYGEIAIKFHPRESEKHRNRFRDLLFENDIVFFEDSSIDSHVLEDLLLFKHFEHVLSCASTVLIYAQLFDQDITSVCIGDLVVKELRRYPVMDDLVVSEDVQALKKFKHIEFLSPDRH